MVDFKGLMPGEQKKIHECNLKWKFGNIVNDEKRIDNLLSFGCYILGYNRNDIIDYVSDNMKLKKQESTDEFCSPNNNDYLNDVSFLLSEKLYQLSGGYRNFFALSGSDANEGAIKLASAYHHLKGNFSKNKIISFTNSYHGSTFLTQNLSQSGWNNTNYTLEKYSNIQIIEKEFDIENFDWSDVCCIIIDPKSWVTKLENLNENFWQKIYTIKKQNDIIIIFDDIFIGGGKTGNFFGWKSLDTFLQPDIFTMGKGITSGYFPLSITFYNEKIQKVIPENFKWYHGFTYSFSLSGILSTLKTLDILEKENFMDSQGIMTSKFHEIVDKSKDVFLSLGYEVVQQKGSLYHIKNDVKNFLFVTPFNADDEYFSVLEKELLIQQLKQKL